MLARANEYGRWEPMNERLQQLAKAFGFGFEYFHTLSICLSPVRDADSWLFFLSSQCFSLRIAMETYIRQRQLIMSPLIPSRVIGENEPLTAVFNKVIATREVNHKGQGKMKCSQTPPPLWFQWVALNWPFCFEGNKWCVRVYRVYAFSVYLIEFLYMFPGRALCDPEAPPRGSWPSQEGLPPLCRS